MRRTTPRTEPVTGSHPDAQPIPARSNPGQAAARATARGRSRPSLLAALAASLVLIFGLAACEPAGEDDAAVDAATDATASDEAAAGDDDYADRMSEQHADEEPLPAFAGDQARHAGVEVSSEEVAYATVDGNQVTGYLAMPEGARERDDVPLPGLIVIHEWWGLNDNVETMARLFAHHGYAALAVDLYGGAAADSAEAARELMSGVREEAAEDNLSQAYRYLTEEVGTSTVGVIGWCFGGGWSLKAALAMPDQIDAAVIYYGQTVEDRERLGRLDMPILGIFGGADQGIPVEDVRRFESTLEELGKDAEIHVYEGAGHAFANPSGERYQPEAAKDAWEKTISFLDEELKR